MRRKAHGAFPAAVPLAADGSEWRMATAPSSEAITTLMQMCAVPPTDVLLLGACCPSGSSRRFFLFLQLCRGQLTETSNPNRLHKYSYESG